MQRFYADTVTGWLGDSYRGSPPGVTAQVYDRVFLHRPVATWRSEDSTGYRSRAHVVELAKEHAARLNRELGE